MAAPIRERLAAEPFFFLPTLDVRDTEGLSGLMPFRNMHFHIGGVRGAIMIPIGPRIRDTVYRQLAAPLTRSWRHGVTLLPPTAAWMVDDLRR